MKKDFGDWLVYCHERNISKGNMDDQSAILFLALFDWPFDGWSWSGLYEILKFRFGEDELMELKYFMDNDCNTEAK